MMAIVSISLVLWQVGDIVTIGAGKGVMEGQV